jgi:hypothetical protein
MFLLFPYLELVFRDTGIEPVRSHERHCRDKLGLLERFLVCPEQRVEGTALHREFPSDISQ